MSRRFLDLAMVAASQGEATPASSVRNAMFGMSSRARKQYLEAQIKETEERMRVAREVLAEGAKDLTEQFEEVHVSARPKVAHDKKETDADDTPLAMPKADVETLRTPLTRTTALPFLTEFASTAESLDSKLVAIVTMTDEEWEERKGASAAKNTKLARWLRACFDLGRLGALHVRLDVARHGGFGAPHDGRLRGVRVGRAVKRGCHLPSGRHCDSEARESQWGGWESEVTT
jgi:Tfp pilus assembly protein PilV